MPGDPIAELQAGITKRLAKAYGAGEIHTIEDLYAATYGMNLGDALRKVDAPVLTSTTGFRNVLYGARAAIQIQLQANQVGALKHLPWGANPNGGSGIRFVTAAGTTANPGFTEGGAIGATVKPTIVPVDLTPVANQQPFEQSSIESKLAGKDDALPWEWLIDYNAQEFKNVLNRHLLSSADTVATYGMTPIDRIIGSYAEIAYGKVANNAVLDANDLDPYGQDRDAGASTFDAYVDGQAFASGDRTLKLSQIDNGFVQCRRYWDDPSAVTNKVIVTGPDTAMRIAQIGAAERRLDVSKMYVQYTMNGIKTVNGIGMGAEVAAYNNVPIIQDANVLQDTISRIYGEDLDHLWLGLLQPVTYLESDNYLLLGKFTKKAVYYMEAEVVCDRFPAQFKVRDLA